MCPLDWQLAIKHPKLHQSESPSIWCTGLPNEQWLRAGVFFPPLPSPSPILNPSTSPLKTLFDSSQLSGSINVQDGGTTSFLKTIHGSRSKIRLLCRLTLIEIMETICEKVFKRAFKSNGC